MNMPPPLPDGYVCPENTVPGWLDENGLPTSCVGDSPLVEPTPDRTPEPGPTLQPPIAHEGQLIPPIEAYQETLAATGGEWELIAAIACLLIAVGLAFIVAPRMSAKPRYKRNQGEKR